LAFVNLAGFALFLLAGTAAAALLRTALVRILAALLILLALAALVLICHRGYFLLRGTIPGVDQRTREQFSSSNVALPKLRRPAKPQRSVPDRDILVTACGRICMYRKKINISTVLTDKKPGIKEVNDGTWLVSFAHYDLGYFDLEQKTLQPLDNPFGPRLSPMS